MACAIQVDFGRLLGDIRLLVERVGQLAKHLRQAEDDLAPLGASSARIHYRSARILIMELDEVEPEEAPDLLRLARRGAQQNRQASAEENGPFQHAQGGARGGGRPPHERAKPRCGQPRARRPGGHGRSQPPTHDLECRRTAVLPRGLRNRSLGSGRNPGPNLGAGTVLRLCRHSVDGRDAHHRRGGPPDLFRERREGGLRRRRRPGVPPLRGDPPRPDSGDCRGDSGGFRGLHSRRRIGSSVSSVEARGERRPRRFRRLRAGQPVDRAALRDHNDLHRRRGLRLRRDADRDLPRHQYPGGDRRGAGRRRAIDVGGDLPRGHRDRLGRLFRLGCPPTICRFGCLTGEADACRTEGARGPPQMVQPAVDRADDLAADTRSCVQRLAGLGRGHSCLSRGPHHG